MRLLLFCLTVLLFATTAAPAAQAAPTAATPAGFAYFPETGHNIGPQLKPFFDAHGGVENFGFPLTELILGSNGLQVQYFERARFEYYPTRPAAQRIELTLVGALAAAGRENEEPFLWRVGSDSPDRTFFPESGHTLGGAFGWVWQSRGGVAVFGYPISEEFMEVSPVDGQTYLVQYFQRARFEYHPELQGQPGEVQLAPLGRRLLESDPLAIAATAPVQAVALLGQATTGFSSSSYERVTNIGRATEMIHGWVVPAGAEFSFVGVGDFSEENGFVDGYAIVGGRLEKVVGGGLCQVSTTLFRAVSNAGLQVTRRVGHSHIVYFYENILGFDATVFTPSVDFRWRNNSPGPVYIQAVSDSAAGKVTFQIWGTSDGRKVSYEGPFTKNWTKPGRPVWQYDKSLPNGAVRQLVHGRQGVDVNYIRVIRNASGAVIARDNYFTRYTPWEDFFIYGPGVTPPKGVDVIPPK
jgi:hypothetical protein